MEEEQQLTKKEKRALAKEKKRQERAKENISGKFRTLLYIVVIGALVIGGYYYLARLSSQPSKGAREKFVSYAEELNLDSGQFESDLDGGDLDGRINSGIAEGNADGVNATPTFILNGEKLQNPRSYDDFRALINGVIIDSDNRISFEAGEEDRVKGNEEAGVVLIEYSDFQCPACGSYYPIVKALSEEFPEELLIVYRHYPLTNIHPNAFSAAKASEAAANQGKFWEMHDMLFERQAEWANLR